MVQGQGWRLVDRVLLVGSVDVSLLGLILRTDIWIAHALVPVVATIFRNALLNNGVQLAEHHVAGSEDAHGGWLGHQVGRHHELSI